MDKKQISLALSTFAVLVLLVQSALETKTQRDFVRYQFSSDIDLALYLFSHPNLEEQEVLCSPIESLPNLPFALRKLSLSCCSKLSKIGKLPPSLEDIKISSCPQLTSLPQLPMSLKKLALRYCDSLSSLPPLPRSVTELQIDSCSLTELPTLPNTVTKLSLKHCLFAELPTLPSVLSSLQVEDCRELKSLPPLPTSLVDLRLGNCPKLASLSALNPQINLVIFNCPGIPEQRPIKQDGYDPKNEAESTKAATDLKGSDKK